MPGAVDYTALLSEFRSDVYRELRPAQRAVLDAYAADYVGSADVGIELPTGAGKSLIALLVAEAWRREGRSAVLLSANKTLARQMEQQADALGVEVRRLEGSREQLSSRDLRAVQRTRAIGVMNYWVYFNQNPSIDPCALLVMDDAHLAEGPLQSLYSMEISRFDSPELFERLADELAARLPHYVSLVDAAAGERNGAGTTEIISFFDQQQIAGVLAAVIGASPLSSDMAFRWGRLRDRMERCLLICSRHSLWLRPWIYPLQSNDHYREAEQRLYMSATIGDPADLSRRLGTQRIEMIDIDPAVGGQSLGRRLVVLDPTVEQDRSQAAVRAGMAVRQKALWMCPSRADVQSTRRDVAALDVDLGLPPAPQWTVTGTGEDVEPFRSSSTGHLFAAGRYDGMDFDGDECRLVVVAGMPRTINAQEEFISQQLSGGGVITGRQNARIVQALGRANRSPEDFAVYVLADPRFAAHFRRESFRTTLPADVNIDIDVAQDLAEERVDRASKRVDAFLRQDFDDHDRERAQAEQYGPPALETVAEWTETVARLEIDGWHALWRGSYTVAERELVRWSEACAEHDMPEMSAFARWCAAKAAALAGEQGDRAAAQRAQSLLEEAIGHGGRFTSWFNGLRHSLHAMRNEAVPAAAVADGAREQILRAFDAHLTRRGNAANALQGFRRRVDEDLASGSHKRYQQALEHVGDLLGYQAVRPKFGQATTDVRWTGVFAGYRELLTLELKIEHEQHNAISPGDVDQALGQVNSAQAEWGPRGFAARGAIVTVLADVDTAALPRLGSLALIRHDAVIALWQRVAGLLTLFAEAWSPDDVDARRVARDTVAGKLPDTGWLPRALDRADPFVEPDDLLAEWPTS
jgi:hypothetical protein